MGIQFKEGYQSVSDWTASYRRFMDSATAQRHLANVERHIAAGPASVLRQQEIIERLESAGGQTVGDRQHRAGPSASNGAAPRDAHR